MSIRPHPKRNDDPRYARAWIVDYKLPDGKRRQEVFDGTEAEARALEQSYRIQNKRPSRELFPSVQEVVPLFKEDYKSDHQPKGCERNENSFKRILPFFGKFQFQSISPQLIEQYKRQRLSDGVKPTTINKELAALSALCKWAVEQGYCEEVRIKRFPKKLTAPPLLNVPSRKEMVKLIRAIPRHKRAIFAVMFYLGLRSQEARDMKKESIVWNMGMVLVVGKGNKGRAIPINRKALPYLRNSIPFNAPKDFRETLEWASKRAGIRYINPHLLSAKRYILERFYAGSYRRERPAKVPPTQHFPPFIQAKSSKNKH